MKANDKALAEVASEVFEVLAFMYVVQGSEGEEEDEDDGKRLVCATVSFTGPFTGCLSLTVPDRTLVELAGNMLGAEEEQACPEEQQFDALGELANVICGNLVASLSRPVDVFNLGKPEVRVCSAEEEQPSEETPTVARLALGEGWADLKLVTYAAPRECEEGALGAR